MQAEILVSSKSWTVRFAKLGLTFPGRFAPIVSFGAKMSNRKIIIVHATEKDRIRQKNCWSRSTKPTQSKSLVVWRSSTMPCGRPFTILPQENSACCISRDRTPNSRMNYRYGKSNKHDTCLTTHWRAHRRLSARYVARPYSGRVITYLSGLDATYRSWVNVFGSERGLHTLPDVDDDPLSGQNAEAWMSKLTSIFATSEPA